MDGEFAGEPDPGIVDGEIGEGGPEALSCPYRRPFEGARPQRPGPGASPDRQERDAAVELGVTVLSFYDRSFAALIEAMFQRDLERCKQVTYEVWRHRGTTARLAELFSGLWEPYY